MISKIIAADIGGSHISSIALDIQNWEIDSSKICETKTNSFGEKDKLIKAWVANLQQSAAQGKILNNYQIAIALPGPFDYENGIFQAHPEGKMQHLVGENFKALLTPYFGENLSVVFENDAACFGLGVACFGVGKAYERSISITLGTGIGSSFIADRQIKKMGKNVPVGGEVYAIPFKNGIADDYFSTRWFVQQALQALSLKVSGVRELVAIAPKTYIETIFQRFSQQLYQFLLPHAQDFRAEGIIVGGNIAKAWPYFGKTLQLLFAKNGIDIQPSTLNEQAIMLGVAQIFKQQYNRSSECDW